MKKLHLEKLEQVTINDCLLAHQMGYEVAIHDGKVKSITKEKAPKKRN